MTVSSVSILRSAPDPERGWLAAGQSLPSTPLALTPAEMETFLLKARIVRTRDAGSGVTNSKRVTLSDGSLTHDAHVQVVDVQKTSFQAGKASELNFKDSYRFNIAGVSAGDTPGHPGADVGPAHLRGQPGVVHLVGRRRGDGRVRPGEVARREARPGADVEADVRDAGFDELIQNRDRNRGNMIWTKDWTLWLDRSHARVPSRQGAAKEGRPGAGRSGLAGPAPPPGQGVCSGGDRRRADEGRARRSARPADCPGAALRRAHRGVSEVAVLFDRD